VTPNEQYPLEKRHRTDVEPGYSDAGEAGDEDFEDLFGVGGGGAAQVQIGLGQQTPGPLDAR